MALKLNSSGGGSVTIDPVSTASNVTITVPDTTGGRVVVADSSGNVTPTGNLLFSGTGQRITGDFSNATISNRLLLQSSTVNGATNVFAVPNGTGTSSFWLNSNSSDTANASLSYIGVNATTVSINSDKTGTGTYLPITFLTSGVEQLRIDTSGNVGIGVTSINSNNRLEIKGQTSDTNGTGLDQGQLRVSDTDNANSSLLIGYRFNSGVAEYGRLQARNGVGATDIALNPGGGNVTIGVGPVGFASHTNSFAGVYVAGQVVLRGGAIPTGRFWSISSENTASSSFTIYNNSGAGAYIAYGGTAWTANSDERLKTTLTPFSNAIEKVCTLRAGTGRYLTDDESVSRSFLIAQDVQQVLPEAVDVQEDEIGTLGLRYTEVIPLLTAAIQEQQALIVSLTARITALENN